MTEHVSDLQWDRLLAGELALDTFSTVQAHAQSCPGCASRLRELTAERDAFAMRSFRFPLRRAPRSRWLRALVPLAAAAAVAMLIAVRPRPADPVAATTPTMQSYSSDSTSKGSVRLVDADIPSLLLFAGRPNALVPVKNGDVIHPGDYLQAGYTAARNGFGAVLSRDGAGSVTAYVPPDGPTMVPLAAGSERSYPYSTILDGVLGSERIAILWCETSHPLEPLLAALRTGRALPMPAGCIAREVTLEKHGDIVRDMR